jgi:hypothetical protein
MTVPDDEPPAPPGVTEVDPPTAGVAPAEPPEPIIAALLLLLLQATSPRHRHRHSAKLSTLAINGRFEEVADSIDAPQGNAREAKL